MFSYGFTLLTLQHTHILIYKPPLHSQLGFSVVTHQSTHSIAWCKLTKPLRFFRLNVNSCINTSVILPPQASLSTPYKPMIGKKRPALISLKPRHHFDLTAEDKNQSGYSLPPKWKRPGTARPRGECANTHRQTHLRSGSSSLSEPPLHFEQ